MGFASLRRPELQRVVVTAALVAILVVFGALGLIAWATTAVDAVELEKEQSLVQRRVERSLDQLVEDVNSASIWNDAVGALAGTPDLDWLQLNFGDYYADYLHHSVTLTWNGEGRLIHASRESEPVDPASESPFAAAVAPLLSELRAAARDPRYRTSSGFDAVVNRSGLVRVGSEVWLVAASTVVPEDTVTPRPSADPVVISGRLVSSLVESLEPNLAIADAQFTTGMPAPGSAFIDIQGMDGERLGVLSWTPDRPGRSLLADAAPIMLGVLLLLISGAVALVMWIRAVDRALAANEDALIEARDNAQAASDIKSRFLANISHELRTPLNGVVAMAEIMAAGDLPPQQRANLDVLRQSASSLTRLIENILEITRLHRRADVADRIDFDAAASVRAVVEDHRPAADAKGLALDCDIEPTGIRHGDEARFRRLLAHLLENAVAYTEQGGVSVRLRSRQDEIEIEVQDTGVGIREDLRPTLFDPFVQGDDSLTKRFAGAGIGLAICRGLADSMGGRIDVESQVGMGSTFAIRLPMASARA